MEKELNLKLHIPKQSYKTNSNNEVVLQLRHNGKHSSIEFASGKGVTPSMLEVGETYLHKNHFFTRKIMAIRGGEISYMDEYGFGLCSAQSFTRTCPTIITKSEMDFLKGTLDN